MLSAEDCPTILKARMFTPPAKRSKRSQMSILIFFFEKAL